MQLEKWLLIQLCFKLNTQVNNWNLEKDVFFSGAQGRLFSVAICESSTEFSYSS